MKLRMDPLGYIFLAVFLSMLYGFYTQDEMPPDTTITEIKTPAMYIYDNGFL